MILSIEETDTGYRIDLPNGEHETIEGDDDAEGNLGRALIAWLGKKMPAKLTLPAPGKGPNADGEIPRFDLSGARSLSDLEDRVGSYLHDNAIHLGKKGIGKLQEVCKDTNFRGGRYSQAKREATAGGTVTQQDAPRREGHMSKRFVRAG